MWSRCALLLKELHVRKLGSQFLHLVGVCLKGGASVPGTVQELTARTISQSEGDGFVTQLQGASVGAGFQFLGRIGFDPSQDLVCSSVVYLEAGNAKSNAVAEEDFGIAFCDDGLDAPALQSLRSVFTAGTATEVLVGNQDGAVLVGRVTEGVNLALGFQAGDIVSESVCAKTFEGHALEEASRNDTVGIDVVTANRNAGTFNDVNRIHF